MGEGSADPAAPHAGAQMPQLVAYFAAHHAYLGHIRLLGRFVEILLQRIAESILPGVQRRKQLAQLSPAEILRQRLPGAEKRLLRVYDGPYVHFLE